MSSAQIVRVGTKEDFRSKLSSYAAKGFTTVANDGHVATLSRKKPFNWVLAIICLFIPILGWIALVFMLLASGRPHEVVELHLQPV